jgi:hypothetical protein
VDHLGAEEPSAQFPENAHPRSGCELLLLARIEVEEAQIQQIFAVAHATHQHAFGAILDGGVFDLALDLDRLAWWRVAQTHYFGFVLVAQRQMQDQVEIAP